MASTLHTLATDLKEKLKVKALVDVNLEPEYEFRGIRFVIIDPPRDDNGLLSVSVRAFDGERELTVNNPLQYKNPPIMVPTGTYHLEKDIKGNTMVVDNLIEDKREVLKVIIAQTIEFLNK